MPDGSGNYLRLSDTMRTRAALWLTVLFLAAAGGGPAVGQGRTADDWWDARWGYRLLVETPPAALRAGINTARLHLADQSFLCLPDGRDVRVLKSDGQRVPHRVEVREDRTFDVFFRPDVRATRYHVYYGNAGAGKDEQAWQESLGGLTLEVRPVAGFVMAAKVARGSRLDRAATRQRVITALRQELSRNRTPYGSKAWGQINDLENPFKPKTHPLMAHRGITDPDDYYLSIYRGTIYCPESGDYRFAAIADDASAFFMERGAGLQAVVWRYLGEISQDWVDAAHPDGVNTVKDLAAGVYRIEYLHVENVGAQLAALGWQLPSSARIETVPVRAFVRHVPVTVVGREQHGLTFCPFFGARHLFNLQVNEGAERFPNYRFNAIIRGDGAPGGGTSSPAEGEPQCEWDFGDGTGGSGRLVEHEFPKMRRYEVTLTITRADGKRARVSRTILPPVDPVLGMRVKMQVQSRSILLAAGRPVELRVLVCARGGPMRTFVLRTVASRAEEPGRAAVVSSQELQIEGPGDSPQDHWQGVDVSYAAGDGGASLDVSLLLHGTEVVSERVAALGTDSLLNGMHLDGSQMLRDKSGALSRLILADLTREQARERRCWSPDGTVKVLVLDELLGGPPGHPVKANYIGSLNVLLSKRYPELKFEFERSSAPGQTGRLPILKFLHVARQAQESKPNIAILVWPPQAVVDGLPLDEFESYLSAAVDQILGQTRAEVVVVTCPPLPGHPGLAFDYARVAKNVGLRKKVCVVDLYSRFRLTEDWQSLFRSERERYPSYLLYPSQRGQEEVAREIYATMLDNFHEEFSEAVRHVQMRGGSGGGAAGE